MRRLVLFVLGWGVRLLLPPSFRTEFGSEIRATFESRILVSRGGPSLLVILASECVDLLLTARREWWTELTGTPGMGRLSSDGRRMSGGEWMSGNVKDLTVTMRSLARRPHLTAGVALTLGLGIGATTTIFTVVNGVMMRPLPYDDASRLVTLGAVAKDAPWIDQEEGLQNLLRMPWRAFRGIDERANSFRGSAAIEPSIYVLPDMGEGPQMVPVARVTPTFFDLLEVTPLLGRTFLPDEYSTSSQRVLLMTYGAWQRRFGRDPSVIGRDAPGADATVVGVLPRDFRPLEAFFTPDDEPEFYGPLPLDDDRYVSRATVTDTHSGPTVHVIAALGEGTALASARRELALLSESLGREDPERGPLPDGTPIGLGANTLHAQTVGSSGRTLMIFFGAAVLLLLIATMNVATLLLARGLDRTRAIGVRMALGASRLRIAVAALTEAAILAVLGGALGMILAYAGVGAFRHFAPPSFPRIETIQVDARVLAVASLIAIVAGVLAGTAPAIKLAVLSPWRPLRAGEGTFSDRRNLGRSALVSAQMAIAVILLTGAGLLFGSFLRIRYADPGFEPDGLVTMSENIEILARARVMQGGSIQDLGLWQFWDQVVDAVSAVPGVESAGATSDLPFEPPSWAPRVLLQGDPSDRWREGIVGYVVTPGYLGTMHTEVTRGRGLTLQDGPSALGVALVNEAFVEAHLRGTEPVGASLRLLDRASEREVRVVGVVEDVVQARVEDGMAPAIYVPHTQQVRPVLKAVVRSALPTETLVAGLRAAADRYNTFLPPRDQRPLADLMSRTHVVPRFQSVLVGAFAVVATLLAAVGLFGSMTHTVLRRRREIGVRMALGAARRDVVRMVLLQGMIVAGSGLVAGVVGARFVTRGLSGLLYQVRPADSVTTLWTVAVLVLISLIACVAPAFRASAVDPMTVLEAE